MILAFVRNRDRERLQQAREIACHRWPTEPLEFRNADWVEVADLETAGVLAIITCRDLEQIVRAYQQAGIRVLLLPEREQPQATKPRRRGRREELAFVPEADPALVAAFLSLPENKLLALVPCLRSLPVVAAMLASLKVNLQTNRKSTAPQIALTRRLCQLRGVIQ